MNNSAQLVTSNAHLYRLRAAIGAVIAVAVWFLAQPSFAEQTEDLLISKLKLVLGKMPANDQNRVPVAMRLADLYAERARLNSMKELEKGCTVCDAGQSDRRQALKLYSEVLPQLPDAQRGKVLSQQGHLYQLIGESQKAEASYLKVIALAQASPTSVAEAYLSIGEMAFKARDFSKAMENYRKVLSIAEANSKGLAAYRLAWSLFNQGALNEAIQGLVRILKTPELGSRSAQAGVIQVDNQFLEEVSRDLATFVSKKSEVTLVDAQLIADVSPATTRLSNLSYLAAETERLGNLKSAVALWQFSSERQTDSIALLESQVHIAQLEFDLVTSANKSSSALAYERSSASFQKALELFGTAVSEQGASAEPQLKEDLARELKARLRKLVLDWNRREKSAPSDSLLDNYSAYLKTFDTDSEMWLLAGQAYQIRKQFDRSIEAFFQAAQLECASKKAQTCEAALLAAIEAAELSANKAALSLARSRYLSLSVEKKRELEVKYQMAHELYEAADYSGAFEAFMAIVKGVGPKADSSEFKASAKLRSQAADLALDSLAIMKADDRLEATARELSGLLPERAVEYKKLVRTSVLNQALRLATESGQDQNAWLALERFDRTEAAPEELAKFWKNRLVLAEKLRLVTEAKEAARQLLRLPQISREDREFALSREAWLSELVLDFKSALSAMRQLKGAGSLDEETRLLKMALYAELANEKDELNKIEAELMKTTKDSDRKVALAHRLVMKAPDIVTEAMTQISSLKRDGKVLSVVALEVFAESLAIKASVSAGDRKAAKRLKLAEQFLAQALGESEVKASAQGKSILRRRFLEEADRAILKTTQLALNTTSDAKLAKSLKARISVLKELESVADRSIQSGDWLNQVYVLSALSRESSRLYSDLMAAPLPKGLSEQEEQEYLQLLSSQAAPFQARATEVAEKLKQFWTQAASVEGLQADYKAASDRVKSMIRFEVEMIAKAATDEELKARYTMALAPKEAGSQPGEASPQLQSVDLKNTTELRLAVAQNPFDSQVLQNLLNTVEAAPGSTVLAGYLRDRIASLQGGAQ